VIHLGRWILLGSLQLAPNKTFSLLVEVYKHKLKQIFSEMREKNVVTSGLSSMSGRGGDRWIPRYMPYNKSCYSTVIGYKNNKKDLACDRSR